MKYNEILIGEHAFSRGAKVFLKDDKRKEHCHIVGATGTGKSKLMEYMIRQDIRNGKGVCLIDPHGNLFESVLKWVVANGFQHRLVVIDPEEKDWSVGLNFLEYDPNYFDAGQHVENVIYGIGKARDENIFSTSQVVIWLTNFLQLAAMQGLTLSEVYHLLNENNKELRYALTERIQDDQELIYHLKEAWNEYDSAPPRTRADVMKLPVWSRVQTFRATKTMRHIVGQSKTTVNFYEAMEKGEIVLINLHGRLSERERNLLGVIIIDKIYQAAMRRIPDRGKFFYVYVDEFGRFVSDNIARALEELRKRHVPFILAHQELEQLRDEGMVDGRRLLASIMTNAKIKIAFRISRADAEAMALEMFAGFIDGDKIKHEQTVTSFWPHKTTATSHARGEVISEGEAQSFMNSIGSMSGSYSGKVYVPGVGFLGEDELSTYSISESMGISEAEGTSRGTMRGYSRSEVEVEFPFYDLESFKQVTGTTFYSIEEIKEKYIQLLQNQGERFFHLRVVGETEKPPIALITPTVKEAPILPSLLRKAKLKSIQKYGLPVAEVEKQCEERRRELLKLQNVNNEPEIEDDDLIFDQEDYEPPEQ
ncbi:MAG: hypothetical protein COV79_03890 [Parcubacteria group bacterium CG11_big_fil_rev_8_21_14_0_20_41_14]|nr:MAG: hypothetical protein COV79_03890 [Parcubacteria group bacterium CG11_big_fil_rev_8_21_14_0_20_41_14]